MAAENASNNDNVTLGNGNVPTPATSSTPPIPAQKVPDGWLVTIILTIYDVIVFLSVSIGYIFQVSCLLFTQNIYTPKFEILRFLSLFAPIQNCVYNQIYWHIFVRLFIYLIYGFYDNSNVSIALVKRHTKLNKYDRGKIYWFLNSANDLRTFDVITIGFGSIRHQKFTNFRRIHLVQCKPVSKSTFFFFD